MKVKVKYSNTQKFIITLEQAQPTLADLKESVVKFLSESYGQENLEFKFSLNGKDPFTENENDSLESLGIVNGDLLTIIQDIPPEVKQTTRAALSSKEASTSSASSFVLSSSSANTCFSSNTSINTVENKSSSAIHMNPARERSSEASSGYIADNCGTSASKAVTLLEAKDGEPPQMVIEAFEQYSPSSASQVLTLLTHLTMMESGFFIQDGQNSLLKTLPLSWKDMVTTIPYHHPGFNKFDCTVVLVTMGNIKQVLASFEGQESELSLRFDIKDYLPSNQILPHRLTKVAQFARTLKNKLLYPLQVAAHETLGLPAPWHLAGLPQELLIVIATSLDLKSILSMALSCKRLHAACQDNKLWFAIFKRDFPDHSHSSDKMSGADWKDKYRTIFSRIKREKVRTNWEDVLIQPNPFNPYPFAEPNPIFPPALPYPINPSYMPQPRGPHPYYPLQPDYNEGPFWDPDNPYFGGDIPPPAFPFPNPRGGMRPRQPFNPLQPPFMRPGHRPNPDFGPRFI